jgi:predicted DNA-binding protein
MFFTDEKRELDKHLTIRLSEEDFQKLARLAKELNMTTSKLVRSWVKAVLEQKK